MFKTEKLTNKLAQQDYEILDLELKVVLEDYYKFLTSKVDKKTREMLKQKYDDTVCYIADRSTPLPINHLSFLLVQYLLLGIVTPIISTLN